jgi:hypothetical protein
VYAENEIGYEKSNDLFGVITKKDICKFTIFNSKTLVSMLLEYYFKLVLNTSLDFYRSKKVFLFILNIVI